MTGLVREEYYSPVALPSCETAVSKALLTELQSDTVMSVLSSRRR